MTKHYLKKHYTKNKIKYKVTKKHMTLGRKVSHEVQEVLFQNIQKDLAKADEQNHIIY